MTINITTTLHDTDESVELKARFVRAGLVAGIAAAAVNTAVVAVANKPADISLEVSKTGGPIPLLGFAQVTLFSALLGIAIAAILRRHSARPAVLFTRIAIGLTVASLIPPLLVDADGSTKVLLIVTHLIAAAIVIPVIGKRLTAR